MILTFRMLNSFTVGPSLSVRAPFESFCKFLTSLLLTTEYKLLLNLLVLYTADSGCYLIEVFLMPKGLLSAKELPPLVSLILILSNLLEFSRLLLVSLSGDC